MLFVGGSFFLPEKWILASFRRQRQVPVLGMDEVSKLRLFGGMPPVEPYWCGPELG